MRIHADPDPQHWWCCQFVFLKRIKVAVHILKLERYRVDKHGPRRKDDTQNREATEIRNSSGAVASVNNLGSATLSYVTPFLKFV